MKKFILLFSLATLTPSLFAENCPTVEDIHAQNFNGWIAYDSDNGTPLRPARLKEFRQKTKKFLVAEWMEDALEGSGHCYYADQKNQYLNAYLSKHNLMPADISVWHHAWGDVMHCEFDIARCAFKYI